MRSFQIQNVRVLGQSRGTGDDRFGDGAQLAKRFGFEHVFDHDVAIIPVLSDLGIVEHSLPCADGRAVDPVIDLPA